MSLFDNFTKDELIEAISGETKWSVVLRKLGVKDTHNKMVPTLKNRLYSLGIDYSSIDMAVKLREPGKSRNQYTKHSNDEIFRKNNGLSAEVAKLAFRRITPSEDYKCAICGLPPFWNGKPLVLTFDHIDGDNSNNEISNLRWVCPNCDRQLSTYAGKNKPRVYNNVKIGRKDKCPLCGKDKWRRAKLCLECSRKERAKKEQLRRHQLYPNRETLKAEIRNSTFISIGNKYGVSDSAIRKLCKKYNLPYKRGDIESYSDAEWELL